MYRSRHQSPHCILAIAALWVLVMGLPRLLVVCTGADGVGRLEFAHAPGACCNHAEPASGPAACCSGHERGSEEVLPSRRCEHVSLAIDLAPPPGEKTGKQTNPPAIGWVYHAMVLPVVRCTESLLPPPTGPPRTDQATSLRATTLLLL